MLQLVFKALWFILPAYVANASAVIVHDRNPIDGGAKFLDGKPLLGKAKTVGGFSAGVFFGTLVGVAQALLESQGLVLLNGFSFFDRVLLAFVLSLGAMTGDSVGSFIKRRFDLKPGQATPFLDQWGFVLLAFFFVFLLSFFSGRPSFFPETTIFLVVLVVTPFLHVGTNLLAYKIGWKEVPW
jgi:CDP-2,3-bis-(O-geranylgeranyl)-sn-glycerol synthase